MSYDITELDGNAVTEAASYTAVQVHDESSHNRSRLMTNCAYSNVTGIE